MLTRTTFLAAIAGLATASPTLADDIDWNNPAGGIFNSAANWLPATIPGTNDRAIFNLSGTYTVTFFLSSRNNARLRIADDTVIMNLAGNSYTLNSTGSTSVSVGGGGIIGGGPSPDGVLVLTSSSAGGIFSSQSTQIGGTGIFGSGAVTVNTNVLWHSQGLLDVGSGCPGTLTVQGGGDISGFMGIVGDVRSGSATVTGAGSTWINTASLDVASQAGGTLSIQAGGLVRNDDTVVGAAAGVVGIVTVNGGGSRWENLGTLILGLGGNGTLNVTGGGFASTVSPAGYDSLGENSGSSGSLAVVGPGSEFRNTSGDLYVGRLGTGTLNVQVGGLCVPGRHLLIGGHPAGSGSVVVSGTNSRLLPSQSIFVGGTSAAGAGTGTLTVNTGGQVSTGSAFGLTIWPQGTVNLSGGTIQIGSLSRMGAFNWSAGTLRFLNRLFVRPTGPLGGSVTVGLDRTLEGAGVEVDGPAGTSLSVPAGTLLAQDDFMIGNTGTGTLSMTGGAVAGCTAFTIGNAAGSVGSVTLDGINSVWGVGVFGNLRDVFVGNNGTGTLTVSGGANLQTTYNLFEIGEGAGSHGTLTVTGAGSALDTGPFYGITVGRFGQGVMSVLAGARVDGAGMIADQAGSVGAATISGQGSLWNAATAIIGNAGDATFAVQAGGAMTVGDLTTTTFPGASAEIVVTGAGSSLTATPGTGTFGQIIIGGTDEASLIVEQGAHAACAESFVGDGTTGVGTVTVRGAGSMISASDELEVAFQGRGTLLVQAGATVSTGQFRIGTFNQGIGEATIDGPGSAAAATAAMSIGGGASGRLTVSNSASVQVNGPASVGTNGSIVLSGGTLTATSLSLTGGSLAGVGTVSANVVNAGRVAPGNSPGILSVQGAYSQSGTLSIELGGTTPGTGYDRLAVSGPVNLSGTVDVALSGGFIPRQGDTFTILTASSVSGSFTSVSLPQLPGGSLRLSYGPTSVALVFCYANCDGSTAIPILNVNDFICFQTKFAAGDPYANCDGSTAPPILNVNDFICFQTAYAGGCP